jgi:hypothetical protein
MYKIVNYTKKILNVIQQNDHFNTTETQLSHEIWMIKGLLIMTYVSHFKRIIPLL